VSASWVGYSQRVAKCDEAVFWKSLRESIRNLLFGWDVLELDVSIQSPFTNLMPLKINVFGSGMELWVFGHGNCPLVVPVEDGCLKVSMLVLC
jgi:hypothetical protein